MKGTIKIMDGTGHSTVVFDTDTGKNVGEAKEALTDAVRSNANIFDESGEVVRNPDLSVGDMTVVPQFQGG